MADNDAIAEALKEEMGGLGVVNDQNIVAVSNLAAQQLRVQGEIEQLEEKLKLKQEELRKISEYDLPNALIEMGTRGFTLEDGSKIEIQKIYAANIKVENRPAAFSWLREKGHEDLIKAEVKAAFGKGDVEAAEQVLVALQRLVKEQEVDARVELDQSVHWQTLRAFVREQIETQERLINEGRTEEAAEHDLPRDLLGVHIIDKAKITLPKKKK